MSKKIVLAAINARYHHTSVGLRYLLANMNELESETEIQEFLIGDNTQNIAEKILESQPEIIGIGVYIWNAIDVERLIETLKKVAPQIKIVLGGPEASYTPFRVILEIADYIVWGEGDLAFYQLCKQIINDEAPTEQIIKAPVPSIKEIKLPYSYYTDHDVENRIVYVEASRGCPFTCEFCLSSIENKVRNFDLEEVLASFQDLWDRGARNFKFIDRTFNLNMKIATRILDFFLEKPSPYFVHFEVIPGHFPDVLKERIRQFPPGALQLEIGIQTLNSEISDNINRKLHLDKITENLKFLESETHAHLHLDLIIGLPGESLESFGNNLNLLASLANSEIQLGILKKLSGTSLHRHDKTFGMLYSDVPPYEILKNDLISFEEMQVIKRFSRYWDLTYNSGKFKRVLSKVWEGTDVYNGFYAFADWLYSTTQSTWKFSHQRLSELLFTYLTEVLGNEKSLIADVFIEDIKDSDSRQIPKCILENLTIVPDLRKTKKPNLDNGTQNKRQIKHLE